MPWRTSQRRRVPSPVGNGKGHTDDCRCSPARPRRLLTQSPSGFFLSREEVAGVGRGGFPQSACQVAPYQRPCLLARVCLLPRATSPSQKLLLIVGIVLCLVISALQDFAPSCLLFPAPVNIFFSPCLCAFSVGRKLRGKALFRQRQSVLRGRLPGESVTQAGLAEGGLTLWRPQRPLEAASLEKGVQSFSAAAGRVAHCSGK